MSETKNRNDHRNEMSKKTASKTSQIIQRGDDVLYEARTGEDRRGDGRGLNPGRRLADHHRVRSAFIERVEGLLKKGHSYQTIASILNDEKFETAGGGYWTDDAIEQLHTALKDRRERDAWLPESLDIDAEDE
ncbi:MAG: hypothetical protein ACPGQS_05920 [Bradymonadia bacterium]